MEDPDQADPNPISPSSSSQASYPSHPQGFTYPNYVGGTFSNSDLEEEKHVIIMDSLDSERRGERPDDMTFDNGQGTDGAQQSAQHLLSQEILFRQEIKIDSERSQCTQESCSAAEESSEGNEPFQALISKPRQMKKPQNLRIRGSSNEDEEQKEMIQAQNTIEFSLAHYGSADKTSSVFESTSEAHQTSKFPREGSDFKSGKKTGKNSNLSGNNRSASNSNNLMSNEFSYSPDFRDNQSNNMQALDQNSEAYSPVINYGQQRKSYIEKSAGQATQLNQIIRAHHLSQLSQPNFGAKNQQIKNQTSILRYEEFEGECYTQSSQQNNETVNTPSAGQVFFGTNNTENAIDLNLVMNGVTMQGEEGNRRYSELTNDRNFERGDTNGSQNNQEAPSSNEFDLSPTEEHNYNFPISPNNLLERKMPTLSIITEEDTQLDQRSVSQYFRMASNVSGRKTLKESTRRQYSYGLAPGSNSAESQDVARSSSIGLVPDSSYYDEQLLRSSSHPMSQQNRKQNSAQSPVEYAQNKRTSIPKSDNNPNQDYSHREGSASHFLTIPGEFNRSQTAFPEDKTRQASQRLSYDIKKDDGEDSLIMRMHSHDNALRQSQMNNIYYPLLAQGNQPELCLISDEDLLSNLDRPSRLIIPHHEYISEEGDRTESGHPRNLTPHSSLKISGLNNQGGGLSSPFIIDEYQLMQKLKEHQALIDNLRQENTFLTSQIESKDEQLNELIQRNQQLESQVVDLEEKILEIPKSNQMEFTMGGNRNKGEKRDFEVQVNIKKADSRRNSIVNTKRLNSNQKMTPRKREIIDFQLDQTETNFNGSGANQTPTLSRIISKQDSSPMLTQQNSQSNPLKSSSTSNLVSQQQEMILALQTQIRNLKDMIRTIQRDHFIDKEKLEGNEQIVKSLNEELKLVSVESGSLQMQNGELVKMVRELERMVEGQKINANDMKIEHEVIVSQMRKRNGELEEELERYKLRQVLAKVIEQGTSTTSLEPFISDQEVQVDIQIVKQISHTRTPSQYSHQNSKEGTQQYPHTIPLPENTSPNQPFEYEPSIPNPFIHQPKASNQPVYVSYSSYQTAPPASSNITIINNKQELSMMIEARNNELRAIELQNEIKQHRNQLLRENQEILQINVNQKEEFRLKLKKREAKIEKLEELVKELERTNNELKLKLEESQGKVQEVRIKMEGKVQEKEFKVITLKNQVAQLQQQMMNAAVTGATAAVSLQQPYYSGGRMYNQQELHSIVNNIVQAKMMSFYQAMPDYQSSSPSDILRHQRSRSQEQHQQQAINRDQQESIKQNNNFGHQSRRTVSPNIEHLKNQYDSSRLNLGPQSLLSAAIVLDESERANIQKKRFENTLIQQRQPTLSNSSPLSGPRSELNRSQPKSHYAVRDQSEEVNKFDSTRRMVSPAPSVSGNANNRGGKTKDSATSPLTNYNNPIVPHELLNLSEAPPIAQNNIYHLDHSRISDQKSHSHPAHHSVNKVEAFRLDSNREFQQKNQLRDKIKRRADVIQLSRNKQKMGQMESSLKKLKNTLSESDFFKRKTAQKVSLGETLQKACTSEISQICDDRLEESRQIQHQSDQKLEVVPRQQLMMEELVTFSNQRDQQIQQSRIRLDQIQLKMHQRESVNQYQESYHSATFRKMSTNQNNSPIRNLQQNFENAHFMSSQSPNNYFQYHPTSFNQSQALTLNPSVQQAPFTAGHSPYGTLLPPQANDLSDDNTLMIYSNNEDDDGFTQQISPVAPSTTQRNQDYLRKLRIRERQSKSRAATAQQQSVEVQGNSTMIGGSSIGKSIPIVVKSVVASEDQRTINIVTQKKPPISNEKRRNAKNQQHTLPQIDSPMVISMYESINMEDQQTDSKPVSNTISQSYLQPCVSSSAELSIDESLRKQQKLEDIMRKYGRSSNLYSN